MYPMYRFMDQHPCQRNQVPYNPHYYPHFESNPHHMNIDPRTSSLAYESWPCGGNYGYPYPPQCHSYCIHNNSPNHCSFIPPYPYIPPPPYSNLVYPGMYPIHYVPPPHFTTEQPRYEYDKNMDSDHHCCGCPNHLCNKKGGSNVKIEEQEQDKKIEGHAPLVPFSFKNSPFPVGWLPPDYMKNGEHMKATGSKGKDQEDSQVLKPYGDFRSLEQPKVWNMWPPYHGNNSESPKQRGGSPSKQCHDDENNKQFPFPIIWMPYKPEEAGGKTGKETDSGNCVEQEPASPSISTTPRLHGTNEERIDSRENEAKSGSEICGKGMNKGSVLKTIPVKQVEPNEKVLNEKTEDASKRHDGDAKEKKMIHDSGKKQSSPSKSSKLPPVCLRVDPLPRKKSSNGSSRSPSPPGRKGKLVEPSSDNSKPPILSNKENVQLDKSLATGMPEESIKVEPTKSKTKVVEVAQGTSKEEKLKEQCTVFPDLKGQKRGQTGEGDTGRATNEPKCRPDGAAALAQSSNEGHQSGKAGEAAARKADAVDDMKKAQRRKLSDDKAATMIQSAYRGFNIRRWEPLNKLKQISKIKGQMAELKNRIQALESSADNGVDDKERTIITEAIMGLLLKLDTIQGLHPTVREYRKSVARDLVSLQEELDLLNGKKQSAESEKALTAKSSEDTSRTMEDHVSLQGGQEVQALEQDDDLGKEYEGINFDTKEPCEENKNVDEVMENFSSCSAVETGHEASELPSESKENVIDTLLGDNAIVVEKSEENDKAEQSLPNPIPLYEELVENSSAEVRDCGVEEKGEGVVELEELPQGVLDEEASAQEDIRKDKDLQHDNPMHIREALGETSVTLGPENMNSSNRQDENSEVLEADATVHIDIPAKKKEEARPLNEDAKISDVDCKVDMEKNGKGDEQCRTASDVLSIQSQDEAITMKQSTDTTDTEDSETAEVLQKKMQNAQGTDIEILDSGISIEPSAEPQRSTVTNEDAGEYHAPDKQNVREENMLVQDEESPDHNDVMKVQEETIAVQGEESPVHSDVVVSLPDEEGQENNVEVEQKLLEENFEMQGAEQVPADNAAPMTEESVDGNGVMTATSEAAATETQLLGEELSENHNTYPSTCDAIDGSSAEAAHSFSSTPTEAQVMDVKEHKEWKKAEVSPSSPTSSQISFDSDAFSEYDRKLIEENEKLREMMEKLIEAGKEQLTTISSLSGRVKDLEKRLSRKKKLKLIRNRIAPAGSACMKPSNDPLKDRAVGMAMR